MRKQELCDHGGSRAIRQYRDTSSCVSRVCDNFLVLYYANKRLSSFTCQSPSSSPDFPPYSPFQSKKSLLPRDTKGAPLQETRQEKKSYLFERIKSFIFTDDDNNRQHDYLDNFEESENLIFFINNIREQIAKQILETDSYNVFYCAELVRNFINLTKHFPI